MIWDSGALQTRQFARRQLALPAVIEVHPDHAEQLRLSFPEEQGRPTVVDVSEGGLGLQSSIFLPRSARLLVRVEAGDVGGMVIPADLALRMIVRRCLMVDVKPTYHIGLQYLEPGVPEIAELVKIGETMEGQNGAADGPGAADGAHAPTTGGGRAATDADLGLANPASGARVPGDAGGPSDQFEGRPDVR